MINMNDVYVEYSFDILVPIYKKMIRNIFIALSVLLLIYSVFFPIFMSISFLMMVISYYYHRHMDLEYEYILYNDELCIYKIIHKCKRKKLCTIDLTRLKLLTNQDIQRKIKTKRYCMDNQDIYSLIIQTQNKELCICIQANEELLNAFKQRHGSKINIV